MSLIFPGDNRFDRLRDGELRHWWLANPNNDGAWKRCDYMVVGRIERFADDGPTYASFFDRRIGPIRSDEAAELAVARYATVYLVEYLSRGWPRPLRWLILFIVRQRLLAPIDRWRVAKGLRLRFASWRLKRRRR